MTALLSYLVMVSKAESIVLCLSSCQNRDFLSSLKSFAPGIDADKVHKYIKEKQIAYCMLTVLTHKKSSGGFAN